ncbi:tyrosine-protein phosphatase [Actinomadura viridis]|uniref:protein-tyrosine phosphatase family protein n=1 Tax=Actinomadura viridis TaxID=58110 RepID=UPI0036905675
MGSPSPPSSITAGNGTLSTYRRPRLKALPGLRDSGVTHVVTLLSQQEGARQLGSAVKAAGLEWTWIPLPNAGPPSPEHDHHLGASLMQLAGILRDGGHILLHCSAGIHRTGMFTYALLRFTGMTAADATSSLQQVSADFLANVGDDRLTWANRLYATWRG